MLKGPDPKQKLRQQVQTMIDGGKSDAEIHSFIQSQGLARADATGSTRSWDPNPEGSGNTFLREAGHVGAWGLGDKINAAVGTLRGIGYEAGKEMERSQREANRKAHGTAAALGDVAGGVMSTLLPGAKRLMGPLSEAPTAGEIIKQGARIGAIYGAAESDGSLAERAGHIAMGAAGGAAGGAIFPAAGGAGRYALDVLKIRNPAVATKLGTTAMGAGLGAILDPDNPMEGAAVGGAVGYNAPRIGRLAGRGAQKLTQMGEVGAVGDLSRLRGPGDVLEQPAEAGRGMRMFADLPPEGRAGDDVGIFLRETPDAGSPQVEILPGGRVVVDWNGRGRSAGDVRDRAIEQVMDEFRPELPPNTFYRFTNNPNEIALLQSGSLRPSRNHVENRLERGLSVANGPHYAADGYTHGYLVEGQVVGMGSDGEPILDLKSLRLASEMMETQEIEKIAREAAARKLAEKGWTPEDLRRVAAGRYRQVAPGAQMFENLPPEGRAGDSVGLAFAPRRPLLAVEARSDGRQGFGVAAPKGMDEEMERDISSSLVGPDGRDLVSDLVAERFGREYNIRPKPARGLWKADESPNTDYDFDPDTPDDVVRFAASAHGIIRGQDAVPWLRRLPLRERVQGSGPGYMLGTGQKGEEPLPAEAIEFLRQLAKNDPRFRLLGDGHIRDGIVLFRNFAGVPETQYRQVVDAAGNMLDSALGGEYLVHTRAGNFNGEMLDALRYFRTVGRDPDAIRRLHSGLVEQVGPRYAAWAERTGGDPAAVLRRIDQRAGNLEAYARELTSPPRRGNTQGALTVGKGADLLESHYRERFPALPAEMPFDQQITVLGERLSGVLNDFGRDNNIPEEVMRDWYAGGTGNQRSVLSLIQPERANRPDDILSTFAHSILSNGQEVPTETRVGAGVVERWLAGDGTLSLLAPGGKHLNVPVHTKGGNITQKKVMQGVRAEGFPGESLTLSPKALTHEDALQRLDYLVQTLGKEGAADFLLDGRTLKNGRFQSNATDLFGPKIGQYALDKLGVASEGSTIDLWMARLYHLLTGRGFARREDGTLDDSVTPEMRRVMQTLLKKYADDMGGNPSSAQAIAWYAIKDLFGRLGVKEKAGAYSTLPSAAVDLMTTAGRKFPGEFRMGSKAQPVGEVTEGWAQPRLRAAAKREGWTIPTREDGTTLYSGLDPRLLAETVATPGGRAAIGAGVGAALPADSPEERALHAAGGGLLLGGGPGFVRRLRGMGQTGGVPAGEIAEGIGGAYRRLVGTDRDRALERALDVVRASGRTLEEVAADSEAKGATRTPLAALLGRAGAKAVRSINTVGGPAAERQGERYLSNIAGQEERLLAGAAERTGARPENTRRTLEEVIEAQQKEGNRRYEEAFSTHGTIDDPRVLQIVDELSELAPSARNEVDALVDFRVRHGGDASHFYDEVAGADGKPIRIPTLRYLDLLKQRVDDEIRFNKQPGSPKRFGSKWEREINDRRAELLDILDNRLGLKEYTDARKAWEGGERFKENFALGKTLFSGGDLDELEVLSGRMPEADRAAFVKGALSDLARRIEDVAHSSDATKIKALKDSTLSERRLRLLIPDAKQYDAFKQLVKDEGVVPALYRFATGGSPTVDKALEVLELTGFNPMDELVGIAESPKGWVAKQAGRLMRNRGAEHLQGRTRDLTAELEPILNAGLDDPAERAKALEAMRQTMERLQKRQAQTAKRSRAGAAVTGGVAGDY